MNRPLWYVLASIACLATACSSSNPPPDAGELTSSSGGSSAGSNGTGDNSTSTGGTTTTSGTAGATSSSSGGTTTAGASTGSGTTGTGTSSSTTGIGSTTQRQLTSTGGGIGTGSTTSGTNGGTPIVGPGSQTFTVAGEVYGLSTGSLQLQNNGADTLTINSGANPDQTFTFATALPDLTAYQVTVLSGPAGLTCSLVNASGVLQGANVVGVEIDCCPSCPVNDAGAAGSCTRVHGIPLNPLPTTFSSAEQDCCGSPGCDVEPSWDSATGLLTLTSEFACGPQQTLFWQNAAQTMDDFTVQFSFYAFNPNNCDQATPADADGFGFFLTPTAPNLANALPANTNPKKSGGLGMNGLGGVGFEFDFFNNNDCSDSTNFHVGLDLLSGSCGGRGDTSPTSVAKSGDLTAELPGVFGNAPDDCNGSGYPSMADKVAHAVSISVAADKVTAFTIDGATVSEMIGADLTNGGAGGLVSGSKVFLGFAASSPDSDLCSGNTCTQYGDEIEIGNFAITVPAPFCH